MLAQAVCACFPQGEAGPSLGEKGARHTGQLQTLYTVLVPCLPRQCVHASHMGKLAVPWGGKGARHTGQLQTLYTVLVPCLPRLLYMPPTRGSRPLLGGERRKHRVSRARRQWG
jgi:hypothetical protein